MSSWPSLKPSSLPRMVAVRRERCRRDLLHFVATCCWIDREPDWVPFQLWPAQRPVLRDMATGGRLVVLKARQLGLTWLALAHALHLALFRPGTTALFFSRGEKEAGELIRRVLGMIERLPDWLRPRLIPPTNTEEVTLANSSNLKAFPTTAGRSYTGSLVVVDEADWIERFTQLMNAAEPTADAGGQVILLSTADKSNPNSAFKALYRSAREGRGSYQPVFLGWDARPDRDAEWYERKKTDILSRTGALDDFHQEYPANDAEALAPRSLDKRLPSAWLHACYRPQEPLPLPADAPSLPGLEIYRPPVADAVYVVAADPAEGNPTSDDSSLTVLDVATGEEVAALASKLDVHAFAQAIDAVGQYYNHAALMVERNNHGSAVLLWLWEHSPLPRLCGHDGKEGWLTSSKGKALLYSAVADALRHGEVVLHSFATFNQLASIDGNTLSAPPGEKDDRAVSFAIAAATAGVAKGWGPPTEPPEREPDREATAP